jgi:hypothetical protein
MMQLSKRVLKKNKFDIAIFWAVYWVIFICSFLSYLITIQISEVDKLSKIKFSHVYRSMPQEFALFYSIIFFATVVFGCSLYLVKSNVIKHTVFSLYTLLVFFQFYEIYALKELLVKISFEMSKQIDPLGKISLLEFTLVGSFFVMFCLYIYTFLLKPKKVDIEEITHEAS